jgi:hypothetical protein
VLTSGREGRRKPNLEVAAGDKTWTAAVRCDGVELLWQRDDDEKLQRSRGLASPSPWWCRLGPVAELDAGSTLGFERQLRCARGREGEVVWVVQGLGLTLYRVEKGEEELARRWNGGARWRPP